MTNNTDGTGGGQIPESDARAKIIAGIIQAQIGTADQSDLIDKHIEEYFTRFSSYKPKFTYLEWYHIFLDFFEKVYDAGWRQSPQLTGEGAAARSLVKGDVPEDIKDWIEKACQDIWEQENAIMEPGELATKTAIALYRYLIMKMVDEDDFIEMQTNLLDQVAKLKQQLEAKTQEAEEYRKALDDISTRLIGWELYNHDLNGGSEASAIQKILDKYPSSPSPEPAAKAFDPAMTASLNELSSKMFAPAPQTVSEVEKKDLPDDLIHWVRDAEDNYSHQKSDQDAYRAGARDMYWKHCHGVENPTRLSFVKFAYGCMNERNRLTEHLASKDAELEGMKQASRNIVDQNCILLDEINRLKQVTKRDEGYEKDRLKAACVTFAIWVVNRYIPSFDFGDEDHPRIRWTARYMTLDRKKDFTTTEVVDLWQSEEQNNLHKSINE